jgi:antitoxin (DNA-binding transcriptional repressor) of toxin-antitoxin stability system
METGAIVAMTTHGGAAADTATVEETVTEAGVAVADLVAQEMSENRYAMHSRGVEEVVADKGYHSNDAAAGLAALGVRTYLAEPERAERNWKGRKAEQKAVYANRRRIRGEYCVWQLQLAHFGSLIWPTPGFDVSGQGFGFAGRIYKES